ncbi:hypothetical protein EVAR_95016_1 [Eumeta japonica]|uniref:Uncharacterized protein n=1 Tax=Eumeta variegata TaxID=151549 RepID=A0A4C1VVZ2_EUMVA|nr:hypothetical protein EVAR_95016_1 [Eumeta japonica]
MVRARRVSCRPFPCGYFNFDSSSSLSDVPETDSDFRQTSELNSALHWPIGRDWIYIASDISFKAKITKVKCERLRSLDLKPPALAREGLALLTTVVHRCDVNICQHRREISEDNKDMLMILPEQRPDVRPGVVSFNPDVSCGQSFN